MVRHGPYNQIYNQAAISFKHTIPLFLFLSEEFFVIEIRDLRILVIDSTFS